MALHTCPNPARNFRFFSRIFAVVLTSLLTTLYTVPAHATSYQQCKLGDVCKIGEFLYNDEYTPITGAGATCTLIAKNPSGTTVISGSGNATDPGDGWYHYDFATTGQPEGLYPSTLCCTIGTEDLCLDKSFEIKSEISPASATDIADAVLDEPVAGHTTAGTLGGNLQNPSFTVSDIWNNPTRTLTSFGSLAGDVWSYSSRSLSTFGSLITDIWNNPDRSLTEGGGSSAEFSSIKKQLDEQRKLLEVLVNEPIIKSYIEEGASPNLADKINRTRDAANTLYTEVQTSRSRLSMLIKNWESLDKNSASSELKILAQTISSNGVNGQEDTSIVAVTKWLEDEWGNPVTTDAANLSLATAENIKSAITNTDYYGTSKESSAPLISALSNLDKLDALVGNIGDSAGDPTLFGHLKKVQQRAQVLDDTGKSLAGLMVQVPNLSASELSVRVDSQQESILAINEFPYSLKVLNSVKASVKNKLYSLQALLDLNRSILASNPKRSVTGTWLEDGSVVFRTVITNPSKLLSQTAELKYSLPKELKKEDITGMDSSLRADYDPDNETLYVEGSFKLGPEEAVVVFVETKDIWVVTLTQIDEIRAKVDGYIASIKDTTQAAEAATLKGEVENLLLQISSAQESATTPSERIRVFRESQLLLLDIESRMQDLKQLGQESVTTSSIKGFIGGSQAIVAWGLIAMFLAGFAFLTLYMKSLAPQLARTGKKSDNSRFTTISLADLPSPSGTRTFAFSLRHFALPLGIVAFALVTAVAAIAIVRSRRPALQAPVAVPEASTTPSPSPSASTVPLAADEDKVVLGKTVTLSQAVTVPSGGSVNFRSGPGTSFPIVLSVKSTTEVFIFGEQVGDDGASWTHIGLSQGDADRDWWVLSSFVE